MTAELRPELVDRLIEFYIDWRRACRDVQAAYEQFTVALAADRALAFAAYGAALDRERSASEAYAKQMTRVERAASSIARWPSAGPRDAGNPHHPRRRQAYRLGHARPNR